MNRPSLKSAAPTLALLERAYSSGVASHDGDGWITSYLWSFGDGTTATGEMPIHAYAAEGTYTVRLTVTDNSGAASFSETTMTVNAQTVIINFDNLLNGFIVTNQYPQVTFSASGFSAGSGGPYGFDLYTTNNSGLGGSLYNAISSDSNQTRYNPNYCRGFGNVFLDFPVPVSNLNFKVLNVYENYRCDFYYCGYYQVTLAYMDVYVNRFYYGTYYVNTLGQPRSPAVPILVNNLSSIQNITGVKIYNVRNNDQVCHQTLFDDFTFTPNVNIDIKSNRINNGQTSINGFTHNALLGSDVFLTTSISAPVSTTGTYSWTVDGAPTITGGSNESSIHIRWNETGTYKVKVTYTMNNGVSASAIVTVKVVIPTLTRFDAFADADQINRGLQCSRIGLVGGNTATHTLGCWRGNYAQPSGIVFTAQAEIPPGAYLSDPADSGIKIKQYIRYYRKRVNDLENGNFQCEGHRNSQQQLVIAWQVDGGEDLSPSFDYPPDFSHGNPVIHRALDAPGVLLQGPDNNAHEHWNDVVLIEEHFETYVEYYAGLLYAFPSLTQTLKLSTENQYRYSRIEWTRNGQAIFDPSVANTKYLLTGSYSTVGQVAATGTDTLPLVAGNGNSGDNSFLPCQGETPSTRKIDGARCFVTQQYRDFLNRDPDEGGWDFWVYQIARCAFDKDCLKTKRKLVARAFFDSAEFALIDPAMQNPPGSPNFNRSVYNPAFVRHCYNNFLQRPPEQGGFDFWVDVLNRTSDYDGVIEAFITSDEYRNYRVFPSCP